MKTLMSVFTICVFSLFFSCNDSPPVGDPGSNLPVIEITEDIDAPATWQNGYVYLIKKNDFHITDTLTIKAGTIVKFHHDAPYAIMSGTGRIIAQGTASMPAVFTSFRDDSHGGDTNSDASLTYPAARDWFNIDTNSSTGRSEFNYCQFCFGGGSPYLSTLRLYGSSALVTNCIFSYNHGGQNTFFYGALDANDAETGTIVTHNRFYANNLPFSIGDSFDIDDSNLFSSPDGAVKNTCNGIFYGKNNHITENVTWLETEVAFAVDYPDLWITGNSTLTLGDNVALKFYPDTRLTVEGGSSISNHEGLNVLFTSYRDDTIKGDTNGDGKSTCAECDWDGIRDDFNDLFFNWININYDSH